MSISFLVGIDSAKVPIYFSGAEIRPVDEKAIMKLIKESKGTIQIPGVKYEETASISVSRSLSLNSYNKLPLHLPLGQFAE